MRFLLVDVLLASLVLAGAGPAQDRRPLSGRVLDAAGKPMANAVVTLTTPLSAHLWVAGPEVLTATTDAQGTFRLDLLVGRTYAGGAVGAAAADGAVAVSPLVVDVAAGAFLTLRLAPALPPLRLRLLGLDAWGADGPRRVRFALRRAPGLGGEVALATNGEAGLPGLPEDVMYLEFLDAAGDTLASAEARVPTASRLVERTLPRPRPLRVKVRDAKGGAVAGARIAQRTTLLQHTTGGPFEQCVRESWRSLGATDASGEFVTRIAAVADWLQVFTAGKPGAATAVAGIVGGKQPVDARHDPQADAAELQFELIDEKPLVGQLLRTLEMPMATASLWVEVTHMLSLPQGGSSHVPLLFPVVTDQRGDWRAAAVPAQFALPRLLAPPGLPRPAGLQLPSILVEASGQVAALDPVVLSRLPSLELQVLRADGGPAEGAVVVVVPMARRRWFVEPWDARHRLDRAGRARIGLTSGEALLFCTDGASFAEQRIDETTGRLELRLEPLQKSVLTVKTPAGAPAAGARLSLASYSPPVNEPDPRRQARAAVAVSLHAAWMDGLLADGQGRFELRTVPDAGVILELAIEHAEGTLAEWRFVPGDRDVVLVK